MSHILQIVWPITDDHYTRSELIEEATRLLDHYAADLGAIISGPPLWLIFPAADVPGWTTYPGSVLVARMPAIQDEEFTAWRARRDIDPIRIEQALAGQITARQLGTAEKRHLVERLIADGLDDTAIGVRLRWSDTPRKARNCVLRFRTWHQIRREAPRTDAAAAA
ncbi:hypothetical protein O7627_24270 [Solwaraspora sp. WMMD1047]|uniref:hypothetical protein n=1 Tax=Solwaraspora sp. WMMD1047 TaxID=3016102 RepID=UPI00241719B3|nr:hypothetical protein [Solwaraspora sp. WMMD1047]MDG4832399.1 hypothetical protein [Solwaraspora sp. WMMD1047]